MLLGISSMPTTHFWVRNMSASIIIYYCFYCSSGNGPWKNHGLVLLNTTPKSQDSRAFLLEWCRWYVLCSSCDTENVQDLQRQSEVPAGVFPKWEHRPALISSTCSCVYQVTCWGCPYNMEACSEKGGKCGSRIHTSQQCSSCSAIWSLATAQHLLPLSSPHK